MTHVLLVVFKFQVVPTDLKQIGDNLFFWSQIMILLNWIWNMILFIKIIISTTVIPTE